MSIIAVLGYWFGEIRGDAAYFRERLPLWFGGGPETDGEIRARFLALVESAERGGLRDWETTPEGRLAVVLVCDQFTRNVHRGTPAAFALDGRARATAEAAIAAGDERALTLAHRSFLYLPFEHSEKIEDQRRSVAAYERLLAEAPEALREAFSSSLDYARRHEAIVARFGRFPHRNAILGRASTAAEVAFLKEPGSSF